MIDIDHLCPGCMGYLPDRNVPCPNCGFSWNSSAFAKGQALSPFTILAGRYLLGVQIQENARTITYLAMDLLKEQPLTIRECFPKDLADRSESIVIPHPGKESDFQVCMTAFQQDASQFSDCDFFWENEAAYLALPKSPEDNPAPVPVQKKKPARFLLAIPIAAALFIGGGYLLHHMGLLGATSVSNPVSEPSPYSLEHVLDSYGTVMEDGTLWLKTEVISTDYEVLTDSGNGASAAPWEEDSFDYYEYLYWEEDSGAVTFQVEHTGTYTDATYIYCFDEQGRIVSETQNYHGGDTTVEEYVYAENQVEIYGYDDAILLSHTIKQYQNGRFISSYMEGYEEGETVYTETLNYEYFSDGSYHTTRVCIENDYVYTEEMSYDPQGSPTKHEQISQYPDGRTETTSQEHQYTYHENGDVSVKYIRDDSISNYTVDSTYDTFGNRLAYYCYYETLPADSTTINLYTTYRYAQYRLKDGVLVSTGSVSAPDEGYPEQKLPENTGVFVSDEARTNTQEVDDSYVYDVTYAEQEDSIKELLISEGFAAYSIDEFSDDSVILPMLQTGEADCIMGLDVHNRGYESALEDYGYCIVIPPEQWFFTDDYGYVFTSIFCYDMDVCIRITQLLLDVGLYSEDSEQYAFLSALLDSEPANPFEFTTDNHTLYTLFSPYAEWICDQYGIGCAINYIE